MHAVDLCGSKDLVEGGAAVPFDVVYGGQTCRAFAVRWQGHVQAYLNRCAHVAMEMDWQPDRFFDDTGQWLLCATHGAVYRPDTGACAGGPCRGGLVKIALTEQDGVVRWHTAWNLQPLAF
ncbi:MAG TPA: Rieske 2Fe-2S domain-containing protein [Ramlibacter sp.]|jgi:nitrite reductase/ring-hydroxylating ferredoxin subunit|uniref:Rieske (2Fe-2S) protein n=1 Tax=Ramlibacter sp. TaxID=1917967 RepID=UPI002D46C89C|nr:Rieske 2Fe-2S domain-containing protein [Ramlibacter sp.]HZY20304.1 Rieske 2Fe-2S domain-containing protein [Ramlibacter sp.]